LENVGSRIKELPARGFFLMAMPYKLGGGSGAPTRLVALLETTKDDLRGLLSGASETKFAFLPIIISTVFSMYLSN
jgi:hypothetical protein